MKRQIFLFLTILVTFFTLRTASAQGEWKWAHSWSGAGESNSDVFNYITNSAFDSEGNIYVWGMMGGSPDIDGFPFQFYNDDPYIVTRTDRTSLLAKFDTLGNMLWYKIMKANDDPGCFPNWMEVKDDKIYISGTCFLDNVDQISYSWLYYFDTLITASQVHAIPVEQRQPPYKTGRYTYFATFDLNGNLLDNHFVEARSRKVFTGGIRSEEYLCNRLGYGMAPMHIDDEGNTYVYTKLEYSGLESDPYTIIIDNDSNRTYDIYLPGKEGGVLHTGMMYKFSPDWELVYAKPMVDHTEGIATSWELLQDSVNQLYLLFIEGMSFDEGDNMYVAGWVSLELTYGYGGELHQYPIHIYWDSTHYATMNDMSSCWEMPFVIKYSPDGDVLWCNQIYTTGSANPGAQNCVRAIGRSCCYENNHLYIAGCGVVHSQAAELAFDDQGHILIPFTYDNHSTGFFVRYNATTGQYVNHGIIPVENAQPGQIPDVIGNRLFSSSNKGAIYQWCVDGTYINDIDISSVNSTDLQRSAILLDSKGHLLFNTVTKSPGTFGDGVSFYGSSGRSNAVFSLYYDPSFAEPYVGITEYDGPKPEVRLWPNPAIERITIESEEEFPIVSVAVADMQGTLLTILPVNDVRCTLNVHNLALGTYIAHVQTKAGISDVKFVVVSR